MHWYMKRQGCLCSRDSLRQADHFCHQLWPPASQPGPVRYLASSMVRGIGPPYAKNLIRAFGEKVT
jgi:hypothetical protein